MRRSLNQVSLLQMLHRIYYLPITQSVLGVFVLLIKTDLYNIILVCFFCKTSIFHAWFEELYA